MDSNDYLKAFSDLKGDSLLELRQKATLLLAVMNLYAHNTLVENKIIYNNQLEATFIKVWNKCIGRSGCDSHACSSAFWKMFSERFWHVSPKSHCRDVLQLMSDEKIKPSKSKILESVEYASFDDDLYLMMTLSSTREELRRTLLSSYTDMREEQIELFLVEDNKETKNPDVTSLYELLKGTSYDSSLSDVAIDNSADSSAYNRLSLDEKIELNLSYFSYLKKNKMNRNLFLKYFPSVPSLYNAICDCRFQDYNFSNAFAKSFVDFLKELKYSIMPLQSPVDFVENISRAIDDIVSKYLNGLAESITIDAFAKDESNGKFGINSCEADTKDIDLLESSSKDNSYTDWSLEDESRAIFLFRDGYSLGSIATHLGRTIKEVEDIINSHQEELNNHSSQLNVKDSKPSVSIEKDAEDTKYQIENKGNRCYVYDDFLNKIYSSTGSIIIINNKLYRVAYTYSGFSVNKIEKGVKLITGERIIKAGVRTKLYEKIESYFDLDLIKDIQYSKKDNDWCILWDNEWYNSKGEMISGIPLERNNGNHQNKEDSEVADEKNVCEISKEIMWTYCPKGKIKHIREFAKTPYDYLLMLAIVDYLHFPSPKTTITFDELSIMMIANAWEIVELAPHIIGKDTMLDNCIKFLINESQEAMDKPLDFTSPKDVVFEKIKDYPMSGDYEDTVDSLMVNAPYEVLNVWLKTNDMMDLISRSQTFDDACLYAIYLQKTDSIIEINPRWIGGLIREYDNLQAYFRALYVSYYD